MQSASCCAVLNLRFHLCSLIAIIESNARTGKVDPGAAVIEILFGFIVEIIDADTLHFEQLLFR